MRDQSLPSSVLRQLDESGCIDAYYDICRRHVLRPADEPIEKMPGREVVKRSQGIIGIRAERGPGTVLVVSDLPEGLRLSFVLMYRIGVCAALRGSLLTGLDNGELGMFRIFCREAKEEVRDNIPDRLYQDPQAYSIDEMLAVFLQLRDLSLSIGEALSERELFQFRTDFSSIPDAVRRWIPTGH